ncbi:hypothetical protein LshimejAT787_0112360 [Lyophyllum shimeji]|uniref:Uncharacterized protein n=1 Tax=Lyophyllum shimeji TaxID=47721 RepID=A0A9P3PF93_LYOSH|nr:hypothetical protein LshimejAT787_0112360 [Lyophyllum shimeji]
MRPTKMKRMIINTFTRASQYSDSPGEIGCCMRHTDGKTPVHSTTKRTRPKQDTSTTSPLCKTARGYQCKTP